MAKSNTKGILYLLMLVCLPFSTRLAVGNNSSGGGTIGNGGDNKDIRQVIAFGQEFCNYETYRLRRAQSELSPEQIQILSQLIGDNGRPPRLKIVFQPKIYARLLESGKYEEITNLAKSDPIPSDVKELSAMNFPELQLIKFSEHSWNQLSENDRFILVVHELLGLFDIDLDYSKTSPILMAREMVLLEGAWSGVAASPSQTLRKLPSQMSGQLEGIDFNWYGIQHMFHLQNLISVKDNLGKDFLATLLVLKDLEVAVFRKNSDGSLIASFAFLFPGGSLSFQDPNIGTRENISALFSQLRGEPIVLQNGDLIYLFSTGVVDSPNFVRLTPTRNSKTLITPTKDGKSLRILIGYLPEKAHLFLKFQACDLDLPTRTHKNCQDTRISDPVTGSYFNNLHYKLGTPHNR